MSTIPEIKPRSAAPASAPVAPGTVQLVGFMLEDYLDAIEAKLALAKPENTERIRWEQLKDELGL
jgi:hypothetical protein